MGRIEEGEELVEALTELCEEHGVRAGQIRAIGSLSKAEIARFEPADGQYQTAFEGEGAFDLISLTGNVSRLGDAVALRLEAMLSVMGPAGPQVLSGQLRSGTAVSCEFVLEIFEDLAIERRLDADTGRLTIRSIRRTEEKAAPAPAQPAETAAKPAPTPAEAEPAATEEPAAKKPIAGKGMSWKDAAEESKAPKESAKTGRAKREPEKRSVKDVYGDLDLEGPLMEPGDILEHPKLGTCRIMKVEEGDYAHVRLPRGRIRKLSLSIVDVEFDHEEDGRKVFKAVISR